jgi:hypothetical protein
VGDEAFVETSGKTVDHLTERKQQFRASLEVFPGLPDRASSRMSGGGGSRKQDIPVCKLCSINRWVKVCRHGGLFVYFCSKSTKWFERGESPPLHTFHLRQHLKDLYEISTQQSLL